MVCGALLKIILQNGKKRGKVSNWVGKQSFKFSLYIVTILILIVYNHASLGNDTISTVHYSDGLIPLDYGKR